MLKLLLNLLRFEKQNGAGSHARMGKTTLKDAEILLIGYAIATDALSCQDYQSVSKKLTHVSNIIGKIAVYFLT